MFKSESIKHITKRERMGLRTFDVLFIFDLFVYCFDVLYIEKNYTLSGWKADFFQFHIRLDMLKKTYQ